MKIKWLNRRPLVAKYNIPVVMVRYIIPDREVRVAGYQMCPAVSFDKFTAAKTVQLSFANQLQMREGTFPSEKLTLSDIKKDYSIGELGVDSFDYKDLKMSKDITPEEFGKLGYCTEADSPAIPFDSNFVHRDKGTIPYYVVYMYGYIPEGTKYYVMTSDYPYYKKIKRYASEKIIYLSINDHKKITELTGYNELLNFIN